jgi:hypothetical protein
MTVRVLSVAVVLAATCIANATNASADIYRSVVGALPYRPPFVTCSPTSYPGADGVCVPYQQEVDSWEIQNYLGGSGRWS